MAYDQRTQYRPPPRPYMNQQAPPQIQKPSSQPYSQNQYNGYGQDGYYNEDKRPYSYKGYDGDGFWEEYGYSEGAQGQYDPYQNVKPPSRQGNYGHGGGAPAPGQQYPQDQRYPPQGRARGYSNRMNGSMQNAQMALRGAGRATPQGYGQGAGPPPDRDYGQQQPGRQQNSPPRQRQDRPPLVKNTSPMTLGFDNPFPTFPGQDPKPRSDAEMVERAMGGLSMSGRPSLDSQRPPTASSRTSKKSSRSNESGQYSDPYYGAAPRPSGEQFRRPSLDDPAIRGPPKRAMTMPEQNGNPVNNRQPNQSPNGMQGGGYGAVHPMPGYQDSVPQRSYNNRMEPEYGPPQRSFTAGDERSQQQSGYNPNQFYGNQSGSQRAPAPAPVGPTNQYQYSSGHPGSTSPQNPRLRESQLDAYMPNFDDGPVESPPLQDPIGLPLDVAPGIQRPPTRVGAQTPGSRAPEIYQGPQGLQRSRSQPDLRDQGRNQLYQAAPDAPPMPRGPSPMAAGMSGRRGSPVYANSSMDDPLQQQAQYATQYAQPQAPYGGYGQGPPRSPRQFHRPGAPRMDTAQSAWSDPGPGQHMEARPPPVRPGQIGQQQPPGQGQPQQRNYNPDALPAHPAPVRPGLLQGAQAPQASRPPPVRQYGSPAQQGQPPPDSGRSSMQEERRMSAPVTFEEISRLRQAVKNNPSDYKTQLTLAKKLVEASVTLSDEGGRADVKTRNKNRENYIFEATKMVRKLVGNGYPEAMFYLADCFGTGQLGFAVDPKEAFKLYQQAAKAGHAASAYRTAVCCEMGNDAGGGTSKDPLKAVQWYRRAATLGDVPAMYKLGMILLKGLLGQQASIGEALIWLQRAAERADEDNPHALHELAVLYETAPNGGKIIRDEAYAYQLFEKAARWGYRLSQCRLGKAYEYGQLGCPIDNRSSIHWYSKAAAQEDHEAELALSGWYLTGSAGILDQSDTEAYLWARKAAMAEMPKAEFAMGYFSEVGIGCPRSLEDAKRWYGRAAAHKYPKAQERLEELKKGGAKAQMKGRERLSRSDRTKHNDDCIVM